MHTHTHTTHTVYKMTNTQTDILLSLACTHKRFLTAQKQRRISKIPNWTLTLLISPDPYLGFFVCLFVLFYSPPSHLELLGSSPVCQNFSFCHPSIEAREIQMYRTDTQLRTQITHDNMMHINFILYMFASINIYYSNTSEYTARNFQIT